MASNTSRFTGEGRSGLYGSISSMILRAMNILFVTVLLFIVFRSFFELGGKFVPFEWMSAWWFLDVGLVVLGGILGSILSFSDLTGYLNKLASFLRGYEGWVLGMGVEVFFEWLENIDGVSKDEAAVFQVRMISLCGFSAMGFLITIIALNYTEDKTGLTIGSFIASAKVAMKYYYDNERPHPAYFEWFMIIALIFSCVFCKVTEVLGSDEQVAAATLLPLDSTTPTLTTLEESFAEQDNRTSSVSSSSFGGSPTTTTVSKRSR